MTDDQNTAPMAVPEQDPCCHELTQLKERYLYLNADFENFRRRTEREKNVWIANAQAVVLFDVLPLIDDIERAREQIKRQPAQEQLQEYMKGLDLIAKAGEKLLSSYRIREITQLTEFDPQLHEAVMQVPSDEHAPQTIVAVLQKGYLFDDQVLRPAKVSVAQEKN